jgi:hypothetical protein
MAAAPVSLDNPQAGAPDPSQGGGAPASAPQANPLQESLGRLAILSRQLGMQNTLIQPEMQQISSIAVQALQKVSQAASGPPQPMSAPPQQ